MVLVPMTMKVSPIAPLLQAPVGTQSSLAPRLFGQPIHAALSLHPPVSIVLVSDVRYFLQTQLISSIRDFAAVSLYKSYS